MQGNSDWNFFSKIFIKKDPKLFEYQCRCLCLRNKGKNWQIQEQILLIEIINQSTSKASPASRQKIKWHEISKLLFHLSNKTYLRTSKQCRQRWNNHLDPQKIKGMWKRQQILLIFQYVQQHGKKWANLVKLFKYTRNQHSIKNKFYSLIKKISKINHNMTEKQMYAHVIAKIQSAIYNDNLSKGNSHSDQDVSEDESILFIQKPYSNKPHNFTSKIMNKLMIFGNKQLQNSEQQHQEASKKDNPATQILKSQSQIPTKLKSSLFFQDPKSSQQIIYEQQQIPNNKHKYITNQLTKSNK